MKHDLKKVVSQFHLEGKFLQGTPCGSGHINDSYEVTCDLNGKVTRYLIQRINHEIFHNIPGMMENIARVTQHQLKKMGTYQDGSCCRHALTLVTTHNGEHFLRDVDGQYWRTYRFIQNTQSFDKIERHEQAYEAARVLGRFQEDLVDLPGPRLHETIPAFHHTPKRFDAFLQAVAADTYDRVHTAKPEIEFATERSGIVSTLVDLQSKGVLTERITHNDTKLNNVLFDRTCCDALCIVDLDTVMPGLTLYDFGDLVRTATNTGEEDDQNLSQVECDLKLLEALVEGYLSSARQLLNETEIQLLPFSGKLMTYEAGLRFLTDYLSGDSYFKTHRNEHNLERARAQFKLVASMEAQEVEMDAMVARICEEQETKV